MRQVVHVVENRVDHPAFPNDACAVIKQKDAFSFYWDGKDENPKDAKAWAAAQRAVREAWQNPWENVGATHYHADYVSPTWSRSANMTRLGKIGRHIFYLEER
jgi:spore germination cell wall hydrolase CwlJ-like protein